MAAQHKRTGGGGWGLVAPNRNKIPAALRRQSEPIYRIFFLFCFVRQPSDRLAQGPWTVPWADGASEGVVQWLQRLLSNEPHQRLCVEAVRCR
jgi:hypothetical protein